MKMSFMKAALLRYDGSVSTAEEFESARMKAVDHVRAHSIARKLNAVNGQSLSKTYLIYLQISEYLWSDITLLFNDVP